MSKRKFIINGGKKYERISYADKLHGGSTVNFLVPAKDWNRLKARQKHESISRLRKEMKETKKLKNLKSVKYSDELHGGAPVIFKFSEV